MHEKGINRYLSFFFIVAPVGRARCVTGPPRRRQTRLSCVFKNDFRERTLRDLSPIAGPLPRVREGKTPRRRDAWLVRHKTPRIVQGEARPLRANKRAGHITDQHELSALWKSCITLFVPLTQHRGSAFYVCEPTLEVSSRCRDASLRSTSRRPGVTCRE